MTTLLCLGYGYCARHLVARHGASFARILGTARAPRFEPGVDMLAFDGVPSDELRAALETADIVLASAAPGEAGDPFLGPLGPGLAAARRKGPLIYLSTIGVHGDSGGAWIDEDAPLDAEAPRARRRVAAEAAWRETGQAAGRPVAILRLGGIYGPGRNALLDIRAGTARCIERPGQVFNRIHVADIAGAIHAVATQGFDGVVNVVDDEPSPSCAPVRFAAGLLGVEPPPAVPFEIAAATMSPMALSFWADNRRVRNDRLHALIGGALTYPTYREGLTALLAEGEGRAAPRQPG
ncbi:NAD-dependent epimerase/dehydratase family protein [Ancylobacter sp. SL191]|uniref:NAD-dependent epimerase/dehydratase family protein n=1 Tax=Ancylobacter sp. SL191 TaxID=2995166 RepID=UPI0022711114|nr:NAD-dependent epimerase/dehydratase family protein [Ancylobacter sp. SL191]WAC28204.1 NAD-dependent dehydratase [Ancylobacter sp. SL191]